MSYNEFDISKTWQPDDLLIAAKEASKIFSETADQNSKLSPGDLQK